MSKEIKKTNIIYFIILIMVSGCRSTDHDLFLIDFDSSASDARFTYFHNGYLSDQNYYFRNIINPFTDSANAPEGRVGELIKAADAKTYSGIYTDLIEPIDISSYPVISMKVMMDHLGSISMKLESSTSGGPNIIETIMVSGANKWEEVYFDFSESEGKDHKYKRLTLFVNLNQKSVGHDVKTYFDEVRIWTVDEGKYIPLSDNYK